VTGNKISKEAGVVKNKGAAAQNKIHSAKISDSKSTPVQKQPGIQLKSGAVFCLPAKSSHSSRIIIPNKRFLEEDYHKVEISPKKPKVENLSADVKKSNAVTVPSTYRSSLNAKKRFKSDSSAMAASDIVCKPDVRAENGKCESSQKKHDTVDVDKEDLKSGSENNKPENTTVQAVDEDLPQNNSVTESGANISLTSVGSPAAVTGSILQRPKLCLDQTDIDRSKLAFAKSIRSQMAEESQSELSDTLHPGRLTCSSPTTVSVTSCEIRSVITSAPSSNSTPASTCSSWNSRTGKCCT